METIHFETLGCKLNQIETESLANAFSEAGFAVHLKAETAPNPVIADGTTLSESVQGDLVYLPVGIPSLCIVNTCTVTGKAEQKARRLIRLLLRKYPAAPVLVTGCYAEVEGAAIAAIDPRVSVFPGTRKGELADLPSYLSHRLTLHPEEPLASALAGFCSQKAPDNLNGTDTFRLVTDNFVFHSRASIKIQDGCNNRCSYCRIRLARGKAVSLLPAEIIDRIAKIETAGWNEVILAGVNLSQYRSDEGDFADLLSLILAKTNRIAIRISSLYPERIDEAILPMLADARIRPHFHLSVQSGSDRILASMRRPYTADAVYRAAERLRSVKENPFLACDIITGFPGESEADFDQTLKLCTDIGFAWIHAFPFSARPGTEAWNMKPRIPERIAGERVKILTDLAEANHRAYADGWVGRTVPAIVEHGHQDGPVTALTANYLSVQIENETIRIKPLLTKGTEISVKLTGNGRAELVN